MYLLMIYKSDRGNDNEKILIDKQLKMIRFANEKV